MGSDTLRIVVGLGNVITAAYADGRLLVELDRVSGEVTITDSR